MVARTPGLIAHVIGLQSRERPMRRIGSLNHWYDGHRRVWFAILNHPEISFGEKIPVQLFTQVAAQMS
jgi:hypothetical protein